MPYSSKHLNELYSCLRNAQILLAGTHSELEILISKEISKNFTKSCLKLGAIECLKCHSKDADLALEYIQTALKVSILIKKTYKEVLSIPHTLLLVVLVGVSISGVD